MNLRYGRLENLRYEAEAFAFQTRLGDSIGLLRNEYLHIKLEANGGCYGPAEGHANRKHRTTALRAPRCVQNHTLCAAFNASSFPLFQISPFIQIIRTLTNEHFYHPKTV